MLSRICVIFFLFGGSIFSYLGIKDPSHGSLILKIGLVLGAIGLLLLLKFVFNNFGKVAKFVAFLVVALLIGGGIYYAMNFLPIEQTEAVPADFAGKTIQGVVRAVPDGRTLQVEGSLVALYGIDAPDLSHVCVDENERPYQCGYQSRQKLENLTLNKPVTCQLITGDGRGNYVAVCALSGGKLDVGVSMVYSGWAVSSHSPTYLPYEQKAAKEKKGLWKGRFIRPEELRKRKND